VEASAFSRSDREMKKWSTGGVKVHCVSVEAKVKPRAASTPKDTGKLEKLEKSYVFRLTLHCTHNLIKNPARRRI